MTTYKKYDAYKDSGIDWLGEIPSHWEAEKAKWLFTKMERIPSLHDKIVTCFRDGEVTLRENRRTDGFTTALKEHGYQGIRKGDLVIHQMDAFAGAIGVSDSDGKSTPVYSVCTPRIKDINQYYYSYLLRNLALSGYILALAKGIRERSTDFRFADFAKLILPLPPLPEQEKIAAFLDKKTADIDTAIAQKREMIELLKERKQILINKAVTRGLNPNAPLRDSGIDWIGEIPSHWEVRNLRQLISLLTDYTANGSFGDLAKNVTYIDEPDYARLVRLTDLRVDFENNGVYINKHSYNYLSKSSLYGGELLMANVGAYAGFSFLMPDTINFRASLAPNMFLIKFNIHLNNVYAYHALNAECLRGELLQKAISAAQPKLNKEDVRSIRFPLPPLSEQEEISNFIETHSSKIDQAIAHQEKEIATLQEYKSTLIDSAVRGVICLV